MNPFDHDIEIFNFAASKEQYPSKDASEKRYERLKRYIRLLQRISTYGK